MRRKTIIAVVAVVACLATAGTLLAANAVIKNQRFFEVAKKLDEGGDFFVYMSVKDALKGFLERLRPIAQGPDAPRELAQAYPIIERGVEALGLYGLEDVGMSAVKSGDRYRTKMYLRIPEKRRGLFRMLGGAPHDCETLRYAPVDTALFSTLDLDIVAGLDLVRTLVEQTGGQGALAQFEERLQMIGMMLQTDANVAIGSLAGEFTLIADFNPAASIALPAGGAVAELPAPRAALMIRVQDPTLYAAFETLLTGQGIATKADTAGLRRLAIQIPPNPVYPLSPTVAYDGSYILVATHAEYLDRLIATRDGGQNLASAAEYKDIMAGLPTQTNGLEFISSRVGEEAIKVMTALQGVAGQGMRMGAMESMIQQILMAGTMTGKPQMGMGSVRVNEEEGVLIVANGAGGNEAIATVLIAPAAIMAAVAVPNFFEAQGRAKVARVMADQRSMATGCEAFFVDNNKYPAWSQGADSLNGWETPSLKLKGPDNPMTLTTPISYLSSVPPDPFCDEEKAYSYISQDRTYIIWSMGPDKDYDVTLATLSLVNNIPDDLIPHVYDPTNGVTSSGDIIRTNQGSVRGTRRR